MDDKVVRSKFLDLLEDRLSSQEREQLLAALAAQPTLAKEFQRYQELLKLENIMQQEKFELNENFTVKVMERIDQQSRLNFLRGIIMKFHIQKRIIISTVASLAVAVILGKLAIDQQHRGTFSKTTPVEVEVPREPAVANKSTSSEQKPDKSAARDAVVGPIVPRQLPKTEGLEKKQATKSNTASQLDGPVTDTGQIEPGELSQNQLLGLERRNEMHKLGQAESSVSHSIAGTVPPPSLRHPQPVDLRLPEPLAYSSIYAPQNSERYGNWTEHPRISVAEQATSTFSIDVDTGSYTNMRRFLRLGQLPPSESVRIEEFINYFKFNYPVQHEKPFTVNYEIAPSPLEPDRYLLKLGVKARAAQESNNSWHLVFLVDVSGSMSSTDKLDLVKKSLRVLVNNMRTDDKISLVTYAGEAGTVLEAATAKNREKILSKIDTLQAGGSTNGAGGINEAYRIAKQHFIKGGVNRVILATDGDFNVGTTSQLDLIKLIEEKRKLGVTLTTLGYGTGNFNEAMMEQLANKGNGNYFYIDSFEEARKVFETDLYGTIEVVAKDVKLQIEFNPKHVAYYRLIGYENRKLKNEDFSNDKIDAGEIGAGHTVTAIYEVALADSSFAKSLKTDSRYQQKVKKPSELKEEHANELAFLRIRYKAPDSDRSALNEFPIARSDLRDLQSASEDFRFAAAVSYFGHILRNSEYVGAYTLTEVAKLAESGIGSHADKSRYELIELIKTAAALK